MYRNEPGSFCKRGWFPGILASGQPGRVSNPVMPCVRFENPASAPNVKVRSPALD